MSLLSIVGACINLNTKRPSFFRDIKDFRKENCLFCIRVIGSLQTYFGCVRWRGHNIRMGS